MKIKVWLVLAATCSLSLVAEKGGAADLQPSSKDIAVDSVDSTKSAKKKKPADTAMSLEDG